jgi:hypothetical protein
MPGEAEVTVSRRAWLSAIPYWLVLLIPPIAFGVVAWQSARPTVAPGVDASDDLFGSGRSEALELTVAWVVAGVAVSGIAAVPLCIGRRRRSTVRRAAWVASLLVCAASVAAAALMFGPKSRVDLFTSLVANPVPAGVRVDAAYGFKAIDGERRGFILETSSRGFADLVSRCQLEYTPDLGGWDRTIGFQWERGLFCAPGRWPADMTEVWLGGFGGESGTNFTMWTNREKTRVFLVANRGAARQDY